MQELGVSFDEGLESVFGHVGDQIVEHAALAEQGMGAGPDGVGLEVMPRLSPAAPSRVSRTTAKALSSSSAVAGRRCGPSKGPCRSAGPWYLGNWAPVARTPSGSTSASRLRLA